MICLDRGRIDLNTNVSRPLNILAFDLDNTLLDPGSTLYASLHRAFLSDLTTDLPIESRLDEFERVRRCGDALERLGLANPIHDRGHPQSIATLILTVPSPLLGREAATYDAARRQAFRRAVDTLRTLQEATTVGTPDERLRAEFRLRDMVRTADATREFRSAVTDLAERPIVRELAERYASLEADQQHPNRLPLLRALAERGITTVVISQGRAQIQSVKLRRLGLAEFFDGRLLVTESASRIAGLDELDRWLDEEFSRVSPDSVPNDELRIRWRFRCMLDRWSRKSPEFYARCLHAIARSPTQPQQTLADLPSFPFKAWKGRNARFVMIGDRLDTDIDPVLASLGPEKCETIHFRCGKYADLAPRSDDARPAPHRTFTQWCEVEQYLLNDLDWDRARPIETPPALFADADLDESLLHAGMRDSLSVVRALVEMAVRTRIN